MKKLLLLLVMLVVPVTASTQVISASNKLVWDVSAPDVQTANVYTYRYYADDGPGVTLVGVTCRASGELTIFTCTVSVPILTSGDHRIQITTANMTTASDKSEPLQVLFVAPLATTQPVSHVIMLGQTATLSVVATGTGPLTYQWYVVGASGMTATPITGATASSYTTTTLTTTTSYWVRIANASGSIDSSAATITVGSIAASFVQADTTTQGSWFGVYGSSGYALANDATALPSYAQVVVAGQENYTWEASTTDLRALQRPERTDRIAATWYTESVTNFTIDVNITDGALHQVALYSLDWSGGNTRTQRVDVLNATTGAVLDTRTVTAFANGQYLVWTIGGHVTLRVTNTGPSNAVVSGLFFDPNGGSALLMAPLRLHVE